jgi:hypothetical protein
MPGFSSYVEPRARYIAFHERPDTIPAPVKTVRVIPGQQALMKTAPQPEIGPPGNTGNLGEEKRRKIKINGWKVSSSASELSSVLLYV